MNISSKRESFVLFLGDVIFFYISLFLMYLLRYSNLQWSIELKNHLSSFSFLFIAWVCIFFILGLYEKQTLILRNRLPSLILNAQVLNIILGIMFFYFIPYFSIAPKTNLFIYLVISVPLILLWRLIISSHLGFRKKQNAILIGTGAEIHELMEEVNNNRRYNFHFVSSIDLHEFDSIDFEKDILSKIEKDQIQVIVVDLKNEKIEPMLPYLYNLIFSHVRFIDKYKVYEDIFDRIPLSIVKYSWFLENISSVSKRSYDLLKRVMDIVIAGIVGIVSLLFYPFVYIAIKLEDGGSLFIMQERIGQSGQTIRAYKFRSMQRNETDPTKQSNNQVTKVGSFIRKTRIDELPQLWSVITGDMSLIGPRPELPSAVKLYEEQIPYYGIRHLIKPGLSGWAQLYQENHPHHKADIKETKVKLSYDLYYVKNRSLTLDLKIALKTLKTFLLRAGR